MKVSYNMTNTDKLKEVAKIDYNLKIYIRKHTEVLMSVGNTEETASTLIIDRLKTAIESVEIDPVTYDIDHIKNITKNNTH